ncbi:hypothetical protein FIV34_11410 [Luteibacter pinisoli]|uniref:Uncharacterized protein n=1 Tax=Luteibacter pinisoli TaxID=2589080 RepID=A0A4Y5Z693_9GAMM|nr:hypothetical protein [Luteibacter pinisoli]QDE39768.1 hypothetical protein FIV34_11410 [Luteibacter pinisoli]
MQRLEPFGRHRVITAFLLAPLTPTAVFMLIAVCGGRLGEGLWMSMIVLPLSYAAALVPGVPLYLLVRWARLRSAWAYCAVGILCALAASIAIWWPTFADRFSENDLAGWSPFFMFGIVAGVLGAAWGYVFSRVMRARPYQTSETIDGG